MTTFKQIAFSLVALVVLCMLLTFIGFPLMRSTQVWSEATVFANAPCKAFGEVKGELCAYTGEVSESFSGVRQIRHGAEVVTLAPNDVAGMSRLGDAKNLTKWKTDLYGGIIMSLIGLTTLAGIYGGFRGWMGELFGSSKKSRPVA